MADKVTDIDAFIDEAISNNKIVIFSKTYCPYCDRAKEIIDDYGKSYLAIELDKMSNGSAIQQHLIKKTKLRTVPQIFISEKFIGGCSDLESFKKAGKLDPMLANL